MPRPRSRSSAGPGAAGGAHRSPETWAPGAILRRARRRERVHGLGGPVLPPERVQPLERRRGTRAGPGDGDAAADAEPDAEPDEADTEDGRSVEARYVRGARRDEGGTVARVTDQATVSLLRWLRRQLRQPTPLREHLEAAVENDDPAEARRIVAQIPFTEAQRRHIEGLIARWEEARGSG